MSPPPRSVSSWTGAASFSDRNGLEPHEALPGAAVILADPVSHHPTSQHHRLPSDLLSAAHLPCFET
jgi:hypothetical protein